MVELCLMASSTYPPWLFHQEQGLCRAPQEFQPFVPIPGTKQEISSGRLQIRPPQPEDPWKLTSQLWESNQSVKLDSTVMKPVLVDVQDTGPDSVLFSFGIAEQCQRHEKILQFLMSRSSEAESDGLDFSLLYNLMGLQILAIYMYPQLHAPSDDAFCLYEVGGDATQPSLFYPSREFYAQKPLLDFVGDLARSSKITAPSDGRVLLIGSGVEMKDLLSIVAEFYLSNNATKCRNQPLLIPHHTRVDRSEAQATEASTHGTSLKPETVTVAPLKSPEKIKMKPLPRKKHSRKTGRERDLNRRNDFYACESLLSLILDKKHRKTAILSLKKSGPELPHFLNQCSAGIAGTGLAVLFSVICKVSGGKVPFCASRLLNTGIGLGLVWLSWAVNTLRDTITYVSKNSSKLGLKEEEMLRKVDSSVKEIFFRAATLLVVAVLRLA